MKLDILAKRFESRTIEVEFPIYLRDSDGYDDGVWHSVRKYTMICEDGTKYEITNTDDEKWEVSKTRISIFHDLYGEIFESHGCLREQFGSRDFRKAMADMRKFTDAVIDLATPRPKSGVRGADFSAAAYDEYPEGIFPIFPVAEAVLDDLLNQRQKLLREKDARE